MEAPTPIGSGHQGRYQLREILNAIFYQNRTGCQWAYLPHDLPPKSATYYYFALWRDGSAGLVRSGGATSSLFWPQQR